MSDHVDSMLADTFASSKPHLEPVPLTAVELTDRFWAPRLRINGDVTLPTQYRLLERTERNDNFRAASGKNQRNTGDQGWTGLC